MVSAVEAERWRSYFGKAGADIWTVIQQAINIAAMDHPKDFRERRGEIAETLFARSLLMMHAMDAQDNLNAHKSKTRPTHTIPAHVESTIPAQEEGELRESETRARHTSKRPSIDVICTDDNDNDNDDDDDDDDDDAHVRYHDQAEALSDELEKETLLIRELDGIKATIMEGDQPESVVLEVLHGLQQMQITVGALKATEIGKHVNCLRKHPSKRVRASVKELVRQWKVLVDEWVSSARDVAAAAAAAAATGAAGTDHGDCAEACDQEDGLPSPPVDEAALLEARAPSVDLSQLFSFMDGEICTGNKDSHKPSNSVEPSVKDNLKYLSRSLSGSMLTDSSDFDTKASTNHPWGHTTPEERGSATRRDMYPQFEKNEPALKGGKTGPKVLKGSNNELGLPVSKGIANGSGPGRPGNEALKGKPLLGGKPTSDVSRSHVVHKTVSAHASGGDKLSNMKSDKSQVDQKLEIAKRKLHQGYQQAENAKKQRTVQVLSFPDLPKAGQLVKGKANQPVQNKVVPLQSRAGFQGIQNRRFT